MVSKSRKRREEKRNRRKSAGKKSPKRTKKNVKQNSPTPNKTSTKPDKPHHYNTRSMAKAHKDLKINDVNCAKTLKYGLDEVKPISIHKIDSFDQSDCSLDCQRPTSPSSLSTTSSQLNFDDLDPTIEFNLEKDISLERIKLLETKILADEDLVFVDYSDREKENVRKCTDELPTNGNLKDFLKLSTKLISSKTDQLEFFTTSRPLTPVELNKLTKDNCVLAGPFKFNPNLLKGQKI